MEMVRCLLLVWQTSMTAQEIQNLITEYLTAGGLFNPEMMEHEKVRDLLIAIRDYLNERR
jgi:hypothetical protein